MQTQWTARAARALALAACALLAACASPYHQPLASENRQRIRALDIDMVVAQETFIYTAASPGVSAAAVGGGVIPALIGAMVDSSVQKSRQEEIRSELQSALDRLLDLDPRAEARQVLPAALANFPLKAGAAQVLSRVPPKAQHEARVAATSNGNAYARMVMHYTLEPKSRTLTLRTHVAVWQDGKTQPSYLGSMVYQGQATPGPATALAAGVQEQVRLAMTDTLRMLAADLAAPPPSGGAAEKPKHTQQFMHFGGKLPLNGERVPLDGPHAGLRDGSGILYSIRTVQGVSQ
jgi:hypothetical protein